MTGGLFAFTVETHDGDGVLLRETLRYAHGEDHVRAALAGGGARLSSASTAASSRREKSIPVPGLVVVAAKPASTAPPSGTTSSAVTVLERTDAIDAARAVRALVRAARLDAARASARTAGEGARRPLGAADRADRRRQDAGGLSAELGGVEREAHGATALGVPPPLRGRGGEGDALRSAPHLPLPQGGGEPRERSATHATHLHRPRRPPRGRAAHALHLAAEGARRRHRAQPRNAGRRDGAADPDRDPHRRHAGLEAPAPAPRSAAHPAHHAGAARADPGVARRAVSCSAR